MFQKKWIHSTRWGDQLRSEMTGIFLFGDGRTMGLGRYMIEIRTYKQ